MVRFVKVLMFCVLVFCFCHHLAAETLAEKPESGASPMDAIGTTRVDSKFSLLDPDRFSMQQSYSISYLSYNGRGQTIGLYLNSMKYELSNSMNLDVTLGWLHQPSRVFTRSDRGVSDYGHIMPNVRFLYQPSEKFRFQISYESVPGVYSGYSGSRWWPYVSRSPF
jgi:hypothetical protein